MMEDKPAIAKTLLSPDSSRLGSDLITDKGRRSSAGSSSGLMKSSVAKRCHPSEAKSHERVGKSKNSSKGQQVLPLNLKGKKSKSSNIPGIVSPGYQRPKSPSKLPVKQGKDKGVGLAPSTSPTKLTGRLAYSSRKHDGRVNSDKLNDNNSNSVSDEMEDVQSWETVSESENETGGVTTAFN
ncbi:hypothetical protein HOLleu_32180 [Holothuria leucospilota]|uniref:Uncharacterized protein n=1 Tax=Holothuria leucospilota TaxID=206669 RepID=A0A9Q0YR96_HOLLE|nr:hypothetical protein HOLleu_32180 [Holothuria leucospilota]